jgi:hypothetical protein
MSKRTDFEVVLRPECGNIRLRNVYYLEQSRDEVCITFDEAEAIELAVRQHHIAVAHACGGHTSCDPETCDEARASRTEQVA